MALLLPIENAAQQTAAATFITYLCAQRSVPIPITGFTCSEMFVPVLPHHLRNAWDGTRASERNTLIVIDYKADTGRLDSVLRKLVRVLQTLYKEQNAPQKKFWILKEQVS
jgi:hypothetical protein